MFHCVVEKNGENDHLRQQGKIAELALGYGGSVGALKAMGAVAMGILEVELKPLVDRWRGANPHIVRYWWEIDSAAKAAVRERMPQRVGCVRFACRSGMLSVLLPSGRRLNYLRPRLEENRYGGESVTWVLQRKRTCDSMFTTTFCGHRSILLCGGCWEISHEKHGSKCFARCRSEQGLHEGYDIMLRYAMTWSTLPAMEQAE